MPMGFTLIMFVLSDPSRYNLEARGLLKRLAPMKIDLKTLTSELKLVTLNITHLYKNERTLEHPILPKGTLDQRLLVLGANCQAGQAFLGHLNRIDYPGQVALADFPGQAKAPFAAQNSKVMAKFYSLHDTSVKGLCDLISKDKGRSRHKFTWLSHHVLPT